MNQEARLTLRAPNSSSLQAFLSQAAAIGVSLAFVPQSRCDLPPPSGCFGQSGGGGFLAANRRLNSSVERREIIGPAGQCWSGQRTRQCKRLGQCVGIAVARGGTKGTRPARSTCYL